MVALQHYEPMAGMLLQRCHGTVSAKVRLAPLPSPLAPSAQDGLNASIGKGLAGQAGTDRFSLPLVTRRPPLSAAWPDVR